MLTSFLRGARQWMFPPLLQDQAPLPGWIPEWSETMVEHQAAIWRKVKPYTLTSVERVVWMCQSIAYVEKLRIPGAIVECGVWKGGSMMAAALSLIALNSTHRQLHLFDTFEGMTPPTAVDVDWQGRSARELLGPSSAEADAVRAKSPLEEVKQAMMLTGYPWEKLAFVAGPVERTLPAQAPEKIALLRLDTDWYESTYHELTHLYPRLVDGGILIVDDYGHWRGSRKAVDDYFRKQGIDAHLHTIDFPGRLLVKRACPVQSTAA